MNGNGQRRRACVLVTPAQAEEWLANPVEYQRPINESHLQTLMADHLAGKFGLSTDAVAFNPQGKLGNGQHRLEMIRRTGKELLCWIEYDVPDDVMRKLGQVKAWTLAERLSLWPEMHQFGSATNISRVVSVSRILFKAMVPGKVRVPTDDECFAVASRFRDSIMWMLTACNQKIVQKNSVMAALVLMHASQPATFEMFADKVKSGAGLQRNDPALTLRDYLLGEQCRTDRPEEQMYKTLRAGEAYAKNEKLFRLQPGKETSLRDEADLFVAGGMVALAHELGLVRVPQPQAGNRRYLA